jgi:ABC-type microcin C transport system permease subunit YejE
MPLQRRHQSQIGKSFRNLELVAGKNFSLARVERVIRAMHGINVVTVIGVWVAHVALNRKWPIAIWEVVLAFNGFLVTTISCHMFSALFKVVKQVKCVCGWVCVCVCVCV